MCPTKDCIFYEGHGGEHFIAQDGKDQSDEIRLRILRDKVAELKATVAALRAALLERDEVLVELRTALKRYGRHEDNCIRSGRPLSQFECECGLDKALVEKP